MKKNNVFLIKIVAFLITVSIMFSGCKKDKNDEDWASKVTGTYLGNTLHQLSGNNYNSTTIISRINSNTINVQLSYNGSYHCLDSVTLNSENTFTINEFDACFTFSETGGGNFSGASISYTLSYDPPYKLIVTGTK